MVYNTSYKDAITDNIIEIIRFSSILIMYVPLIPILEREVVDT